MLVCLCNMITKTKIRDAYHAGARDAAAVFKHLRIRPNCANCKSRITAILSEAAQEPALDAGT